MSTEHDVVWTPQKVADFWGFCARRPELRAQYFAIQVGDAFARCVSRRVTWRTVRTVLDYGCGSGALIQAFLARDRRGDRRRIFGLDASSENVAHTCKTMAGKTGFGGAFLPGDIPKALRHEAFDLVTLTEVVEHLTDAELGNVLSDVHGLLRPGGFLVVSTPNDENLLASSVRCPDCACVFHRWQHVRTWTRDTLSATLSAEGFAPFRVDAVCWPGPRVSALLGRAALPLFSCLTRIGLIRGPSLVCVSRKKGR